MQHKPKVECMVWFLMKRNRFEIFPQLCHLVDGILVFHLTFIETWLICYPFGAKVVYMYTFISNALS